MASNATSVSITYEDGADMYMPVTFEQLGFVPNDGIIEVEQELTLSPVQKWLTYGTVAIVALFGTINIALMYKYSERK